LSIGSSGSILSIGSSGSILSIGSVGSIASVCSAFSAASVASVLSVLSFGSVLSWRSRRRIPVDPNPAGDDGGESGPASGGNDHEEHEAASGLHSRPL